MVALACRTEVHFLLLNEELLFHHVAAAPLIYIMFVFHPGLPFIKRFPFVVFLFFSLLTIQLQLMCNHPGIIHHMFTCFLTYKIPRGRNQSDVSSHEM